MSVRYVGLMQMAKLLLSDLFIIKKGGKNEIVDKNIII
jgi:hypothetical protein